MGTVAALNAILPVADPTALEAGPLNRLPDNFTTEQWQAARIREPGLPAH
jgi:hypothetical protein